MAIDPMLYEKISGRSGDPYARMGEALAGSDAAKSRRSAEKERSYFEKSLIARYQYRAIAAVVGIVVLGVILLLAKVFG